MVLPSPIKVLSSMIFLTITAEPTPSSLSLDKEELKSASFSNGIDKEKLQFFEIVFVCVANQNLNIGNFPGGPVTGTLCSQCRGPGLDPWSGNQSHMLHLRVCMPQIKIPHAATNIWHS